MTTQRPISSAQQEYISEKIFPLVQKFPDLTFEHIRIREEGNEFSVSVSANFDKKSLHVVGSAFEFSEAVILVRKRLLRQIFDVHGKRRTATIPKTVHLPTQ